MSGVSRTVFPILSYRQEKTLSRVSQNGRVEERRDTDIKSTATFGKLSALPLGEEFVFDRSAKRNETSAVLTEPNEIKPFPSLPKCSGISRFHNDRHRHVWCRGFLSWR
ncbi:hypothetical protein AVEN_242355-1 [Araneus ventricosus]|uniref:Uncharacterized protein n=1 Tax=Araneus ventricosus TaxID=182803 RepID=A0A4Y2VW03_ARAVE|nr:hypothetical protein AVEN_146739-1 [Araneus ventricosus]GBO28416.1 hypothetical protein AVEN_242355-1 [Araneus ventricosus]